MKRRIVVTASVLVLGLVLLAGVATFFLFREPSKEEIRESIRSFMIEANWSRPKSSIEHVRGIVSDTRPSGMLAFRGPWGTSLIPREARFLEMFIRGDGTDGGAHPIYVIFLFTDGREEKHVLQGSDGIFRHRRGKSVSDGVLRFIVGESSTEVPEGAREMRVFSTDPAVFSGFTFQHSRYVFTVSRSHDVSSIRMQVEGAKTFQDAVISRLSGLTSRHRAEAAMRAGLGSMVALSDEELLRLAIEADIEQVASVQDATRFAILSGVFFIDGPVFTKEVSNGRWYVGKLGKQRMYVGYFMNSPGKERMFADVRVTDSSSPRPIDFEEIFRFCPDAPEKMATVAELIRSVDDRPDPLHREWTPAVEALIEMGPEVLPFCLELLLSEGMDTRLRGQTVFSFVLEQQVCRETGYAQGTPELKKRYDAIWKLNGGYRYNDTRERREASVEKWRHWLRSGMK